MKKLIIASNNQHKIIEIKEILKDYNFDIRSLKECNIDVDIDENGDTFKENAMIKAEGIYEILKEKKEKDFIVMSDDSGLEVDYLNGEPGVYSARYAGEHGNSELNNEKLLKNLNGVEWSKRTARFKASIALINDKEEKLVVEGQCDGIITESYGGNSGFGYDPIFYIEESKKTFAQMSTEEKNLISHRGRALEKVKEVINKLI